MYLLVRSPNDVLSAFANDRDHDPVLRFHRDANIDRVGAQRAVADQARGRGRGFRERQGERAQDIQRRARFRIALFAVFQDGIETNRNAHRSERARPAPTHRVGHAGANRARVFRRLFFQGAEKTFQVLDRDAPGVAATGDGGEIGLGEFQLGHARLHPRRKIARAFRARGHRQDARLDRLWKCEPARPAEGSVSST